MLGFGQRATDGHGGHVCLCSKAERLDFPWLQQLHSGGVMRGSWLCSGKFQEKPSGWLLCSWNALIVGLKWGTCLKYDVG